MCAIIPSALLLCSRGCIFLSKQTRQIHRTIYIIMSFPTLDNPSGRFPGCDLSVISEGSYRTSHDGSSHAGTVDENDDPSHGIGMSRMLSDHGMLQKLGTNDSEDEGGEEILFRTFDDEEEKGSVHVSSTHIVGMGFHQPNNEPIYNPDEPEGPSIPVFTISQALHERPTSNDTVVTIQKSNQENSSWLPLFLRNTPFWIWLTIVVSFLLCVVCLVVGLVAYNMERSSDNDQNMSSSQETLSATFPPALRVAMSPSASPSMAPALQSNLSPTVP